MWAAIATRPDITFTISTLSQYLENPGRVHWEAAKRVLKYLKGMKTTRLTFGNERNGLEAFMDADLASQEHRHSISGYIFMIDSGAGSWSAKKQSIIALSTAEAEYIAATHVAKEALWICTLISNITRPLTLPTILYCDNQASIALMKDAQYHTRMKHIDMRFHFIRETVKAGSISILYCPTKQ